MISDKIGQFSRDSIRNLVLFQKGRCHRLFKIYENQVRIKCWFPTRGVCLEAMRCRCNTWPDNMFASHQVKVKWSDKVWNSNNRERVWDIYEFWDETADQMAIFGQVFRNTRLCLVRCLQNFFHFQNLKKSCISSFFEISVSEKTLNLNENEMKWSGCFLTLINQGSLSHSLSSFTSWFVGVWTSLSWWLFPSISSRHCKSVVSFSLPLPLVINKMSLAYVAT